MKSKLLAKNGTRTFAVVLQTDEEAVATLLKFAREHDVSSGQITGIGAFRDAVLGFFDFQTKAYERIPIDEQVEIVSLVGNFATQDGEPRLHPHVVVSDRQGRAWGGHLLEGRVRPTLEIVVTDAPAHLRRHTDPETGLPLIAS